MIDVERIKRTVERNTIPVPFCGCWIWTGYIAHKYPQINLGHRKKDPRPAAHIAVYLAYNGAIPPGHVIRHTCDVASCCNPAHLITGTYHDNMMDCLTRGRQRNQNKGRLVCKNGHALLGENVKTESTGFRRCQTCVRAYQTQWRNKRKIK